MVGKTEKSLRFKNWLTSEASVKKWRDYFSDAHKESHHSHDFFAKNNGTKDKLCWKIWSKPERHLLKVRFKPSKVLITMVRITIVDSSIKFTMRKNTQSYTPRDSKTNTKYQKKFLNNFFWNVSQCWKSYETLQLRQTLFQAETFPQREGGTLWHFFRVKASQCRKLCLLNN